jgi:hypothetical protein
MIPIGKSKQTVVEHLRDMLADPLCLDEMTGYQEKAVEKVIALLDGIDIGRLEAICDAERDGRLVVLPCKVGSDLWSIERARTKCTAHGEEYSEYSCQGCEEPCDSVITQKIRRVKEASHMTIAHFMQSGCFGKTVFLTREEAEKALLSDS